MSILFYIPTYSMHVLIKPLTGQVFALSVEPSYKIALVKLLIEVKKGRPADEQRLIFAGNELEDGRTLSSYNIENGSTIELE